MKGNTTVSKNVVVASLPRTKKIGDENGEGLFARCVPNSLSRRKLSTINQHHYVSVHWSVGVGV